MPITFLPQNIGFIIMGMSTRAHYPRSRSISEYRGYTWVIDVFSFLFLLSLSLLFPNRDLKIRRRRRQQEHHNNFARASCLFVHFFAVTARLRRENAEFHDVQRKYKSDDEISSLFLTVNMVLRNSALGWFAYI